MDVVFLVILNRLKSNQAKHIFKIGADTMSNIINNVVKLYLKEYESVFDMAADADYYEKMGYVVFCYGESNNLISVSEKYRY